MFLLVIREEMWHPLGELLLLAESFSENHVDASNRYSSQFSQLLTGLSMVLLSTCLPTSTLPSAVAVEGLPECSSFSTLALHKQPEPLLDNGFEWMFRALEKLKLHNGSNVLSGECVHGHGAETH